jgi:hypothetical protein
MKAWELNAFGLGHLNVAEKPGPKSPLPKSCSYTSGLYRVS